MHNLQNISVALRELLYNLHNCTATVPAWQGQPISANVFKLHTYFCQINIDFSQNGRLWTDIDMLGEAHQQSVTGFHGSQCATLFVMSTLKRTMPFKIYHMDISIKYKKLQTTYILMKCFILKCSNGKSNNSVWWKKCT